MESRIRGGPPNSTTTSDTLKNMALFLSSSNVHFSFIDFRISILPFQPTWIYLTLGLDGKDLLFIASLVGDTNFMRKVDT